MGPTAIRNRPSGPPSIRYTRDRGGGADRGKSPSVEELMRDSRLNMPEWRLQRLFSKLLIAGVFFMLASDTPPEWPDRVPQPARSARLTLEPIELRGASGGPITVTGAWKLTADDVRVMGLSALAVLPDGRVQALSDSGALVTFARPGGAVSGAVVRDLPDGPGFPTFKKYRDSEAMIVNPDGRDRLVTFESRHSLWRFEENGAAKRVPLALPSTGWSRNKGIEAMVRDRGDGTLVLLHEGGRFVLRVGDSPTPEQLPLTGATGGVADAVQLPDGRIVIAVREIGLLGLTNKLAWLERTDRGYHLRSFATLPLGPFDNVEGLAAEVGSDGRTILWAVTDNDGWRRTLLLRMTLDTTKAPAKTGA